MFHFDFEIRFFTKDVSTLRSKFLELLPVYLFILPIDSDEGKEFTKILLKREYVGNLEVGNFEKF